MDNLGPLGVGEPRAERRQNFSSFIEPRCARDSGPGRELNRRHAAAVAFFFSFSGGEAEPEGNFLFARHLGEKLAHGRRRIQLRVIRGERGGAISSRGTGQGGEFAQQGSKAELSVEASQRFDVRLTAAEGVEREGHRYIQIYGRELLA